MIEVECEFFFISIFFYFLVKFILVKVDSNLETSAYFFHLIGMDADEHWFEVSS